MRDFYIEGKLHKILKKLSKKDKLKYEIIWKKIKEIITISYVGHYKNLKSPLNEFKRVHIDKSFVLVFKYDQTKDEVRFYDFDHHDKIYLKKF